MKHNPEERELQNGVGWISGGGQKEVTIYLKAVLE